MVDETRVKIEVERLVNLITAVGWSKIEERLEDDTVTVTVKKEIKPITPE